MKSRTLQVIFEKIWKFAHILIWLWTFSSRTLQWYTFIIFFFCLGPVFTMFTLPFHSTVGAIPFCLNHASLLDFPRKLGWYEGFFSSKKACSLLIEPLKMKKELGIPWFCEVSSYCVSLRLACCQGALSWNMNASTGSSVRFLLTRRTAAILLPSFISAMLSLFEYIIRPTKDGLRGPSFTTKSRVQQNLPRVARPWQPLRNPRPTLSHECCVLFREFTGR